MTAMVAGPLRLRNPIILAAGLLGDSPEKLRAAYDAGAGAVVTKSITSEPREGNTGTTFIREGEGWLNSVGLKNPGAKAFASALGSPDYPVIVSLAGSIPDEFADMTKLFDGVAAFEINVSCPNVGGHTHDMGQDPRLTGMVVTAVKEQTPLPVFVKVGINMREAARAAIQAGADGIVAINSVPAMKLNMETGKSIFDAGRCGLSGPPIHTIALNEVYHISRYGAPVIGCGGVTDWRAALSFMQAGAWAVQVGAAAIDDYTILGRIAGDLSKLA